MADCASLLDEELSSFVFSYLTDASGSQYGEEEVCSDRLDFADIDLSQLDAADLDGVGCLGELHWCADQRADASPASAHYSADPLFETEEENAALLAALSDSLEGMVDAEVGGISIFPALEEEEPVQEEEEEESHPLGSRDLSQVLGAESEDPSLLKKLLLTPPNLPAGSDTHKERVRLHRHGNRSLHLRPLRPPLKSDAAQQRKPRAVRPAGRLCTELHRHLTTAQDPESNPAPETEEEESESEEDEEEDEEEEEEEESSSSEVEGAPAAPCQLRPQFSCERELLSVVELITYMHTYCLPSRKQQGWERRERDAPRPRARPDASRQTNAHTRVVLVAAPGGAGAARRLPFARRRETKADSLLRQLLQQGGALDVSRPYRLHSPPYSPLPGASAQARPPGSTGPEPEPGTDSAQRSGGGAEAANSPAEAGGSFSVRRSLRLASFPSRFAKRLRPVRSREGEGPDEDAAAPGGVATAERLTPGDGAERSQPCGHHEKRVCLRLPLHHRPAGESQFSSKALEPTLDLCGTAGLTPPTTPPHKPAEDELFKPTEAAKGGGGGAEGGVAKGWPWPARGQHQRKVPEQTELYAQLLRTAQPPDAAPTFGDHDYCALSLGEKRKRSAAMLGAIFQVPAGGGVPPGPAAGDALTDAKVEEDEEPLALSPAGEPAENQTTPLSSPSATPPSSEEEAERSSPSRSPSPVLHLCPDSSETTQLRPEEERRSPSQREEDDCQVFYIHNLPSGVTQSALRRRFQVFGQTDCQIIICNQERCGVITIRQPGLQRHRRERDALKRLSRKRYLDLDEAAPGPVRSKYAAPELDALRKEAQTLQR